MRRQIQACRQPHCLLPAVWPCVPGIRLRVSMRYNDQGIPFFQTETSTRESFRLMSWMGVRMISREYYKFWKWKSFCRMSPLGPFGFSYSGITVNGSDRSALIRDGWMHLNSRFLSSILVVHGGQPPSFRAWSRHRARVGRQDRPAPALDPRLRRHVQQAGVIEPDLGEEGTAGRGIGGHGQHSHKEQDPGGDAFLGAWSDPPSEGPSFILKPLGPTASGSVVITWLL